MTALAERDALVLACEARAGEALRQVRGVELDIADVDRVVGLLVDEVLSTHSVPLTRSGDSVEVPDSLLSLIHI